MLDYDFVVEPHVAPAVVPGVGLADRRDKAWIHVHGSMNSRQSGMEISRRTYKRMYWQGYDGHAFSLIWEGNYGFGTAGRKFLTALQALGALLSARTPDLYNNFVFASMVAGNSDDLRSYLMDLNSGGFTEPRRTVVMSGHSCGNNLISQLVLKCPPGTISRFVKMQSAAAGSAYANTPPTGANSISPGAWQVSMVPEYDYLGSLSGVASRTGIVNLHSDLDSTLALWLYNETLKPKEKDVNRYRNKHSNKVKEEDIFLLKYAYLLRSRHKAAGEIELPVGSNQSVEHFIDDHSKMHENPLCDVWEYFEKMKNAFE